MSDVIDAVALVGTIVSLGIAYKALRLSTAASERQQELSLAQVRPWIVMNSPCELKRGLEKDQTISFIQKIEVLGSQPAVRMRTQSWWSLVTTSEAAEHCGLERFRIQRRIGEGSLIALAPGQKSHIFNSPDMPAISLEQLELIDRGTHAIRIVNVIEYESVSSPGKLFRSSTAVIGRNANVHAQGSELILQLAKDGLHLQ
ncbi:hypothetical protein M2299_000296 [Stenotrophomonas sp. 1278]|jgi:hypothetical protein|uniref:hypothetical protein n=1 Tax=Stenotrophomonas sp. 1278 TaxID=2940566 RepID=UPI002473CA27|nr:hypothetical protein [Stenotrophomonas sp. 1278]MDH6329496.1 hypothetical protein [Stenotrophomonas sp. 1278]